MRRKLDSRQQPRKFTQRHKSTDNSKKRNVLAKHGFTKSLSTGPNFAKVETRKLPFYLYIRPELM
jgi:hypothetical protein